MSPKQITESYPVSNQATQTESDRSYKKKIQEYFSASSGTTLDKLNCFTRFVPRQTLTTFLARHEIFREILHVHGAIVEGGVFTGAGLFSWAQFSAIYEPYNHNRRILGFDTFSGLSEPGQKDRIDNQEGLDHRHRGAYGFPGLEELEKGVELYDLNRPIGHISRVEIVAGDSTFTIPRYLVENPHLVVALLYLDFDLYEPTRAALDALVPRMPRGAVIGFDELNQRQWPGETLAALESVGLRKLRIRRFPYSPGICYAILD